MGKDVQTAEYIRWRIFLALAFILILLENPLNVYADPATMVGAFLISLAVSAASTAAQFAVSYLLTPKPKAVDKGKLEGDVKITGIGEGVPIPEIYGGSYDDKPGGFEHGGVIVWASQIRKVVVQVPGGGGGKGGPRAAPQSEHHYYQDLVVLVGKGPLEVLAIHANTDLIGEYGAGTAVPYGTTYEAERTGYGTPSNPAVHAGTVSVAADATCSNGYKATNFGGPGNTITWLNVEGDNIFDAPAPGPDVITNKLYVRYKCPSTTPYSLILTVNGVQHPTMMLPYTAGIGQVMFHIDLDPGPVNTIVLSSLTASADIDRLVLTIQHSQVLRNNTTSAQNAGYNDPTMVNTTEIPRHFFGVTGRRSSTYMNPVSTYDNFALVDPTTKDTRPLTEWNDQSVPDTEGVMEATTVPVPRVSIYPGTMTQLPDPLLQNYYSSVYGDAGAAPAYRGRCYVVFENMETTKYGGVPPNFTFRTQHATIRTLGAMFKARAEMAGLAPSETDFSDLNSIPLRGYGIMQKQSPARDMELLSQVYDVDVFEDINGVITGYRPSETVATTIPIEELDVRENYDPKKGSTDLPSPVQTIIKDEYQLPKILTASFFDIENNFEVGSVNVQREYTISDRHDSFSTGCSMSEAEAQRFVDRELQRRYAEKDAVQFSTFYKYAGLTPTQLVRITEYDGTQTIVRIKAIDGWVPGVLTFSGVVRNIRQVLPRAMDLGVEKIRTTMSMPSVPGIVIGTIIDVGIIRSTENSSGAYVACCLTNQQYTWKGATLFGERDVGVYEKLIDIADQAVMGRTVLGTAGMLPLPTGVYPESATVDIDLFCGELRSKAAADSLDRGNVILIGNELLRFQSAEVLSTGPNRYRLHGLWRADRGTSGVHVNTGERVVLMNGCVKWIPFDYGELGLTRNYKFAGGGQTFDQIWSTSFTYNGDSIQNSGNSRAEVVATAVNLRLSDGVLLVSTDNGVVTVTLPPVAKAEFHAPWTIKKIDAKNAVIIQPHASNLPLTTIDGQPTYTLRYMNESIDIVMKNGQWWVV